MPALVAGIHVFVLGSVSKQDVDARPRAGHDEVRDQGNDNNNR